MDRKPKECKAGAPAWMVTYGDLVTLLMCFFVLLFAFSEIDAQKFEAVMQSFQGSAGVLEAGKSLSEDLLVFDASPETDTSPETTDQEQLEIITERLRLAQEDIKDAIEKAIKGQDGEELKASISVEVVENKIIIRLKNNVLFDPAKAEIKIAAIPILSVIGEVLQGELFSNSDIKIEGHTDDIPINTLQFPSNWELSAGRASSVLKFFRDELAFEETRLSIAGYAEFQPIKPNDTPKGRAENRRVEIIIEKLNIVDETDSENE